MGLFDQMFGKGKPKGEPLPKQSVTVFLKGTGLPDQVYIKYDLTTLERLLEVCIKNQGFGEMDGTAVSPSGPRLFMYGPDGDKLFKGVEATLRHFPLCQGAKVVIRYGPPGSPEKEVML
jgi:hypothetical protein